MKEHNATTAVTTVIAAGNYDFIHIKNISDTTIYFSYDGSATTLTTSNGLPVAPDETLVLHNDGTRVIFRHPIKCIHTGVGSKALRVQGSD
jgi:hypothetical protein